MSSLSPEGIAGVVISVVIVSIIIIWVCFHYGEKVSKEIISELSPFVHPPQRTEQVVQPWEVDDTPPTMQKFFHELAQENPVHFTAQQIITFTNNYSTLLGRGGFGNVYKGKFPDPNGAKIAVKVLKRGPNKNTDDQFMAEVGTIARTRHINLVRLYGFCHDRFTSALVYEYMENGSLEKHLFHDTRSLGWVKLHEIAIGTAKGIAYLHEECHKRIIHYDIKPENILLDSNFTPKVADFGLAKLCNRDDSHVTNSGYRGTRGYSAPEFMLNNYAISYKCDVYSFGILLFEIVGRRRNARVGSNGESVDWFPKNVWEEYEKGEIMRLIEVSGIEEKDRMKAERMAMVAIWCVQDSPEARPPMSAVVKMLEGGVEVMPPPKPFRYLFSVESDELKESSGSWSSSGYATSDGTNTHWYREATTTVIAKHEIQVATSSV